MPPEAPLPMPVQALDRWDPASGHRPAKPARRPWAARAFVFGGAALLTAYGALEMYEVVAVSGGTTALQYVLLVLFTLNFSWIALSFMSAILGFATLLRRPKAPLPPTRLATKTAIVMPVYNEATARTFAAVEAMRAEIDATGLGEAFDYFVLSDSTVGDAWIAEERAFLDLRARWGEDARLYYRHRAKNHHRKAGNIGDFVSRWGRGLRPHAGARRRQPDDRTLRGPSRRRHGGGPGFRHHPVAAAHHQPQHPVRPRPAIRRPHLRARSSPRASPSGRAATAITGATTPSSAPAPSRRPAACPTSRANRPSAATSSATISSRRR